VFTVSVTVTSTLMKNLTTALWINMLLRCMKKSVKINNIKENNLSIHMTPGLRIYAFVVIIFMYLIFLDLPRYSKDFLFTGGFDGFCLGRVYTNIITVQSI